MDFFYQCLRVFVLTFIFCLPFVLAKTSKTDFVYDRITLEIQPTFDIDNYKTELNNYRNQLHNARICHRDRIHVVIKPIVHMNFYWWTRNMVLNVKKHHHTIHDGNLKDRHLFVFVAILKGRYLPKKGVAGLAFKNHQYIIMFRKLTFYTLIHETGHIMGMVRRDQKPINPKRPLHCNNKDCVMYWKVNRLGQFDQQCQSDIDSLRS